MPPLELSEFDQSELLRELGDLIAARGHTRFVAWPIVQPSAKFLPEEWAPSREGVAALLRRLMLYANIDLPAQLVAFNRHASELHPNAPAWFAGIRDGVCRFGLDIHEVNDPQSLITCLCHEIAHAYRALHLLVDEDREVEERLTDLTTIYLGFGIFSVNGADRYRQSGYNVGQYAVTKWSISSLGYLDAETLSFLFAAQLVARGANVREYVRHLEANQAGYVRAYCELLDREDILEQLLLPEESSWPAAAGLAQFTGPVSDAEVEIVRDESLESTAPRPNEGRPVFRVRDSDGRTTTLIWVGGAAGFVLGLIASMIVDHGGVILLGAAAGIAFALFKGRHVPDYCSGPGCRRSRLAPDATTCEHCGGVIRGRIADFRDHLAAEEEFVESQ